MYCERQIFLWKPDFFKNHFLFLKPFTRFCYITSYIRKRDRFFIYNLKLYSNAVTSATSKLTAQENFNISNNIFIKQ